LILQSWNSTKWSSSFHQEESLLEKAKKIMNNKIRSDLEIQYVGADIVTKYAYGLLPGSLRTPNSYLFTESYKGENSRMKF
jgi:hypothetical protein